MPTTTLRVAGLAAALLLGACSIAAPALDDATDTTRAQRCADYRATVAMISAVQGADGSLSENQARRLATLQALIAATCDAPAA